MAIPPILKRISQEDLSNLEPEVRKGLIKLLSVMNPFIGSVTDSLNNRLTFKDNFSCVVKELTFDMPTTDVPVIITGYGTAYNVSRGPATVRRNGNFVEIRGLLTHRATDLSGFTTPIFKVPKGYYPHKGFIGPVSYVYEPASVDISGANGEAFLAYAASSFPSSHIDLDCIKYYTIEDVPSFPAPFPLEINCRSLATKPIACIPLNITDETANTEKFSMLPKLGWTVENKNGQRFVQIHRAENLIDGRKYKMTVLVF